MLRQELEELIANGESSGLELKRDDVRPEQLAKEIVALANVQGGRILLGVEDDGQISGLQRTDAQDWVLNVFRDKVHPQIIPFYEEVRLDDDVRVGVISLAPGISKPYVVRHNGREEIYIRMGNRSEIASREQQLRLFETGGLLHAETLPVAGTSIDSLDLDRLDFYLRQIIQDPDMPCDGAEWQQRLLGLGLMAEDGLGHQTASIAGILGFGVQPRRALRQAGLRIMVFDSREKTYATKLDSVIDGPFVARRKRSASGSAQHVDDGLIEKLASTLRPFISRDAAEIDESMRRQTLWDYPWEAVREVVINALAHRDWTRSVDIEISCYSDRLEVISPGRLQNAMTIAKMIAGQRSPRNPILMDILRDYGYVEARGMGVRTKVIPAMRAHNGTEPVFELNEDALKVTLYQAP
ncbi:ATP-binding protein [Lamprobacter modestohalophilus]|uniref:RNA-binding domain-containing protein n=1 Tax=Lamprobacter modestohalophilus TaxID=1064514 RepID=UPI002ADEB9EE|nr:RNA-binding domain-containing protein [Lamprobacter modestohalophilus]MEA1049120.1 ATP-binding protein [Lamprobacter modestohalophilus]